jgi:hypothetical protein
MADGSFVRGFEEISDHYGRRFPNHLTFAIGISYLDEHAFASYVMNRKWNRPENVVLVIQPENGPTRIWRPIHAGASRRADTDTSSHL